MFSFEGDYKSKPTQALGGRSRKEPRELLIQRTLEDRKRRELLKKQQISCTKIQACFRSAKTRHTAKLKERQQFDAFREGSVMAARTSGHGSLDLEMDRITMLTRQLLFFYNQNGDDDRLTWLCQLIIKHQKQFIGCVVTNYSTTIYQIKKLLKICCIMLERNADSSNPIAIALRMLEIFTDLEVYRRHTQFPGVGSVVQNILEYLVQNGYYHTLRILLDNKVPECIENPELLMSAQTSIAGTLLVLIRRPLCQENVSAFMSTALQSLCREMLCTPQTEAINRLLIPDLVRMKYPFPNLLSSLILPHSLEAVDQEWLLSVPPSIHLLYSILRLGEDQLDKMSGSEGHLFLKVLCKLMPYLRLQGKDSTRDEDLSDSDDDSMDVDLQSSGTTEVCRESLRILGSPSVTNSLLTLSHCRDIPTITALCILCHNLMKDGSVEIHNTRLLYSLAFDPQFLANLWNACLNVCTQSNNGVQSSLLQLLSRGLAMSTRDLKRIIPLLSIFCSHFGHFMMSLHDSEFHSETLKSGRSMPFSLAQLAHIAQMLRDACLGIIELTHPDAKPFLGTHRHVTSSEDLNEQQEMLIAVFKVMVKLVKQLFDRDCRRRFCPEKHWLSSRIHLDGLYKQKRIVFVRKPFGSQSILNPHRNMDEDMPLLSTNEVRKNIILSEMPFVVPFEDRVKFFRSLVRQDKDASQDADSFRFGHSFSILARRSHLYEDAFEKLSLENEPDLRKRLQVQLVNFAGLDEAGIDGGGIFREFMSELMKTSFDPNRGFFKYTSDKLLYPNPLSKRLVENFTTHYYFLGRILGKAIYENMLMEMLPFASFFLSKLLSRHRGDVDIHHLASLDPEMYKNLLSLKDYEGDVSDLGLDFTVVNNEIGEAQMEELKPGGKDMLVTNQNRIEYIHLMADYRLNRQMRQHCNAFRSGLANVINIDWLRLFDHNELQLVVSGVQKPIDLNDLRQNTNYSGGYTADHPVIVAFWRVTEGFTDKQKCELLKFVTSCSRPPILGFKELYPAFCIHHAGNDPDRLPTASTCMNLLKLPEFHSEDILREKLLYAIESEAGFELS